ncbi:MULTISPECIES: type II secretion system protein GspL [unclassified Pseudomonas]|uniref:type II secretion system protein GspL n=1 Tax=unclassified Pseudomonas TaxID=196821 RepID=UPI0037F137D7
MKLEWRRRAPARSWLLLRPGDTWDWLLVENGVAQREGQGQPPADLQAQVVLIVPGERCSQFQLAAPPGLRRDEWPLLLEDQLLQSADEVYCACLSRREGQLHLLVVARQPLDDWRRQCAEWGLQIERCWAEFQLLPTPEPGTAWEWLRSSGLRLYLGLSEEGHAHWLAWPEALGDAPQQPWRTLSTATLTGSWPSRLAPLDQLPSLFERPRQVRALPGVPTAQRRLIAACLGLAVVCSGLWLSQQWRQVQAWRAQVLAVTGAQPSPRHAAQALKRLREGELQQHLRARQLEDLQARLHAWLHDHPHWRLQAVRFDGQRWHVRLEGDASSPPWGEMATAAGATVQVESTEPSTHVVFDLGAAT